ncbi:MAG: Ig-like domain-containing protein [Anaerovoracaceae bacterium]
MAIKTVRAQINGQWHTLTLNPSNGHYEAEITAPSVTSYNQPNHYYNVTVEATNDAGTTVSASGTTIPGLRLQVRERIKPVVTITSPSNGARITNNKQPVLFTATDETNGSGVDLSSLVVKLDDVLVPSEQISNSAIANGYSFTYTPAEALSDGSHTVTVDISDHDGNTADQKTTTFIVDTVAPTLNVTAPTEGYITNTAELTVVGTTNDVTSSPVTVKITLNSADQGAVTVNAGGAFSKEITLAEGANVIVITATDAAGKSTSVTRNVTLDTSQPAITSATITPNPVDAGKTMLISVVIE